MQVAVCPECGGTVPFGGGRTVKNAHTMLEYWRALKPTEGDTDAQRFADEGWRLANDLHAYGHKQSMTNPDWAAAGLWTQQARGRVGH